MIQLAILGVLLQQVIGQSQATLTQPPLIETNTYTLRKNSTGITGLTTTINYMQTYSEYPQVYVSIITMNSFTAASIVSFVPQVKTITLTSFTLSYSLFCLAGLTSCSFAEIDIDYLVYDFLTYPFVQILEQAFTLDPTVTITNQFYQIDYMERLEHGHSYSLNCMLSGFQTMVILSQPTLYIDTIYNNRHSYYLNIRFGGMTVATVHYVRILIDETTMNLMNTGQSSLSCDTGTIYHYSDANAIEHNPSPDFLPFAMFFGVSGFGGWKISLSSLVYIFNNTTPRMQANIGYILFITSSCPSNQLYVSTENLCYSLSSAFYYQATPATMQPCPYSCYQCIGPLTTNCKSCVQGWNRILSSGRCVCISGFYDPGAPQCKNCTQAIAGCKTCSSATNCLTCLPGCNAIGFNPIYCDCPANVQLNYLYNCPSSFYFDYSINSCACLPQTYYNSAAKLCFPCATGCYICAKNSTYCFTCIDSYQLINNTCSFFYTSYALLGQVSTYNTPKLRCLRWDRGNVNCLQKCKYYFYQFNCYTKCPQGTFNISFPWLTCQPCQLSCNFCYNFTICYQCSSTYYYFNTTILSCSPCSSHCVKCLNASYCTLCETYYNLTSTFSCQLPAIPTAICESNCSYCLLSHLCLQCQITYYLNSSSQSCITCSQQLGLQLWSDGCHEICGDGKLVNDQCDDGNIRSGDGCSSRCFIQTGFTCRLIQGRSYCWGRSIPVSWDIYSILGDNLVVISLFSPSFNLANALIDLQCGFSSKVTHRATVNGREELTLSYQQSIINMASNLPTSSKTTCILTLNQQQNYTISVNNQPSLIFIDYHSTLQSLGNSKTITNINKVSIYFSLATSFLGISPMGSYSCIRIYALLLVSYVDYMHVPINAFAPYQALEVLYFVPSSTTTKDLSDFSNDYATGILWHLVVVYVCFAVWLELGSTFLLKVSRSMEWGLLTKTLGLICETKSIAYQNMYISFEVGIWCVIVQVLSNLGSSSAVLIFLVSLHLVFIVCSKIHFWFTFETLSKNCPQFTHALIVEQLQNISIAVLLLSTSEKSSYVSLLMVLFAGYPLLSLSRNIPSSESVSVKANDFHISNEMAVWQLRVSYIFQIVIQLSKVAYMWCGNIPLSESMYETIGANLGRVISLLASALMILGSLSSLLAHLIRICEIRNQGKSVLPSSQNLDLHTVDASSHAE